MSMNLNDELANLAVSYRGLAENADREVLAREEARERAPSWGADPRNLPDPEDCRTTARYWRFHEQTAKSGFLYYADPPPGTPFPQVAVPSYHEVTTAAIAANRIKYGSSNDLWRFTDTERPRPPAAKPAAVPTEPAAAWRPSAGARQTASSPPPQAPRGKGELSPKQIKTLKKVAKRAKADGY